MRMCDNCAVCVTESVYTPDNIRKQFHKSAVTAGKKACDINYDRFFAFDNMIASITCFQNLDFAI
jgi:hypothetical protein